MRKYLAISTLFLFILMGVIIPLKKKDQKFKISIELKVEKPTIIGLFYNNDGKTFDQYKAIYKADADSINFQTLTYEVDKTWNIKNIRFDFDSYEQDVKIKKLVISDFKVTKSIHLDSLFQILKCNNYILSKKLNLDYINLECQNGDPFVYINDINAITNLLSNSYLEYEKWIKVIFMVLIINTFLVILIYGLRLRKNKWHAISLIEYLFIVIFLIGISIPIIVQFYSKTEYMEYMENRILAKKFTYSGQSFSKIIHELDTYFLDHFGLRKQMIQFWCNLNYKLFDASSLPSKVQIGSEDWLFAYDYAEITHALRFQDFELDIIRKNVEEKSIWLKSKNIKFYLLLTPSKPTILPEYLPPMFIFKSQPSIIDQVKEACKGIDNLVIIDLQETMLNAKDSIGRDIYYKSDTHWNNLGGFIAYQYIMSILSEEFHTLKPYKYSDFEVKKSFDYNGDLYKSLAIEKKYKRNDFTFTLKKESKAKGSYSFHNTVPNALFYENMNDTSPSLFMIRDSYGVALVPFMLHHFKRSVFLWNDPFNPSLILREQPDIFIKERLEIYLRDLLEPNDSLIIKAVDSILESTPISHKI